MFVVVRVPVPAEAEQDGEDWVLRYRALPCFWMMTAVVALSTGGFVFLFIRNTLDVRLTFSAACFAAAAWTAAELFLRVVRVGPSGVLSRGPLGRRALSWNEIKTVRWHGQKLHLDGRHVTIAVPCTLAGFRRLCIEVGRLLPEDARKRSARVFHTMLKPLADTADSDG